MEYRLVERERFAVVGKGLRVSYKNGENLRRIPEFWEACGRDGTEERLMALSPDGTLLGICLDMDLDREEFTYLIAVEKRAEAAAAPDPDLVVREIPAATWAVFTSIGPLPAAIQQVWQRIGREWFPATGYAHAGGPDLEVYPPGNPAADDYRCEVWIPVVR